MENGELLTGVDTVRFETSPETTAGTWRGSPAGTTMRHVHFYVGDLEQAKMFYHFGLGLDITTWRYPGALFTSAGGYHHHVGLNVWVANLPVAAKEDYVCSFGSFSFQTVAMFSALPKAWYKQSRLLSGS